MDDPRLKAYFDACFLEYKALRDEIQTTISEFYRLLQFGSAALLGFMGIGFNFWHKEDVLVKSIFAILVPALSFVCVQILIGQIARIRRASTFCQKIESKLRIAIGDVWMLDDLSTCPFPLSWETWIFGTNVKEDKHFTWVYSFAVEFFVCLSISSVLFYDYYSVSSRHCALLNWSCLFPNISAVILLGGPALLEVYKAILIWRQVTAIARPYRVALIAPVRFSILAMVQRLIIDLYNAGVRTVAPSSIMSASVAVALMFWAFGLAGAVITLTVIFGGTFASSLPRLLQNRGSTADLQVPRTWRNVVANGGVSSLMAVWYLTGFHAPSLRLCAALATGSLAGALSDTMSHECGVLFGGTPRLITTLRLAKPGQNGAVSALGTLTGIVVAIGFGSIAALLKLIPWDVAIIAAAGGFFGNLIDSVLGATIENMGWLNNNGVNFCCTSSAAVATLLIGRALGRL
jgi:uncharacterized protein (TIGR00297 family)